jgi:hypothetical protein
MLAVPSSVLLVCGRGRVGSLLIGAVDLVVDVDGDGSFVVCAARGNQTEVIQREWVLGIHSSDVVLEYFSVFFIA